MTKARSNATAPAAKGQIVVGTGTDASGILSVGSANQVLTVDSSTATGLKWAAVGGTDINYTLLNSGNTTVGTSSSKTWTSINGYNEYYIFIENLSGTGIQTNFECSWNADSTGNHSGFRLRYEIPSSGNSISGGNVSSTFSGTNFGIARNGEASSTSGNGYIFLSGGKSTAKKPFWYVGGSSGDTYGGYNYWGSGTYDQNAVISSFKIATSTGNFDGGNVYIYGA